VSNLNIFQTLLNDLGEGVRKGNIAGKIAQQKGEYNPSVLNVKGAYNRALAGQGVSFADTPVQAIGALGARLTTDLTNDGTRGIYWRYNHPNAMMEQGYKAALGRERSQELGPLKTGLIGASIAIPATALSGAYDITNVGEQFRPKGFAQQYTPVGAEDRRESEQAVPELIERFALGRSGQPLKYATAKQDIPDLTPERYGNYMRNYYQNDAMFGLVKATPENLQGVPEVRILNYPITIPSATTAIGGIAGAAAALRSTPAKQAGLRRGLLGSTTGALAGALTGSAANAMIAQGNRPQLPTIGEYELGMQ